MEKKKNVIIAVILIFIIIFLILGMCIIVSIPNKDESNIISYKKQVITILEEYKKGDITNSEVKEKIHSIRCKIDAEPGNKTSYSNLSTKIMNIELNFNGKEISNSEIDNYIKELK